MLKNIVHVLLKIHECAGPELFVLPDDVRELETGEPLCTVVMLPQHRRCSVSSVQAQWQLPPSLASTGTGWPDFLGRSGVMQSLSNFVYQNRDGKRCIAAGLHVRYVAATS